MTAIWNRIRGRRKMIAQQPARTRVEIYTKADCCLCDHAKEQLQRLRAKHDFELAEIDIAADEALLARYGTRIPLIRIAGRTAFKFHLDEREFVRKLHLARLPARGLSNDSKSKL